MDGIDLIAVKEPRVDEAGLPAPTGDMQRSRHSEEGSPRQEDHPSSGSVLTWLCEGDPAVVWQVQRDLLGKPPRQYEATRARIASEGFGATVLARRDADGTWGHGLYSPKWVSTFYTMRLLYQLGLDGTHPAAVETCSLLLDEGFHDDGSVGFWGHAITDCCVNAMMVALAVRFGHQQDERVDAVVQWLLDLQLEDGGWNCMATRSGCDKSSFHTTLSTLEALWDYRQSGHRRGAKVDAALRAGHDYFLRHRIFRSERTGRVVRDVFTQFSFPPRWHFDALRAADHFRAVGHAWDERLEDVIALIRQRRETDGRWANQNPHRGKVHLRMEKDGQPSRFNTLRALRVLAWAEAVGAS